jgi:hypothetical protein
VQGRISPRRQGDLGEASAIDWLTRRGAIVLVPFSHSPNYDLVADIDGELTRIQAKTATCERRGRYEVMLATRGGNQSWNGVVKRFDSSRYDALFVVVSVGRRWFIPSAEIGGCSRILLGGPKYARWEVESASALPLGTQVAGV